MTIGLSIAMRDERLQLILDAIDFGADEYDTAHLLIYSGERPVTGGVPDEYDNVLLVNFPLSYPCGTITDGVLEFNTIEDVNSLAYGAAVWARITDSSDTFVADLSVTSLTGGGDILIDGTEIFADTLVTCVVATITEGNV
jgi:hypothetical protein